MEPRLVDREAFTVMGVAVHNLPDKIDFKAVWEQEFMPHHDAIHALSTDKAYYGVWFPQQGDGIPDYVAGMAVPDDAPASGASIPDGVMARRAIASRYAVFECAMNDIGATYKYVYETWLPASPYEFTPGGADFEYYPPEGATGGSPAIYIPIRDRQPVQTTADAGFLIGQMRVQTMREEPFFYIASTPLTMAALDPELNRLMPLLEAAHAEAHVGDGAPVIIRYFPSSTPDTFLMEVGIPVKPGTQPAGEAQVKTLPPYRCASLLYCGGLAHIQQAYGVLTQAIKDAGLKQGSEGREWYYHFEGDASPNNVIGLYLEII